MTVRWPDGPPVDSRIPGPAVALRAPGSPESRISRPVVVAAAREAAVVAFALLAYCGVRVLVRDGHAEAIANAHAILRLETALHLAWERPVQQALLEHAGLVRLMNWIYIWGHWPVLVGCAVFLYVRRRDVCRRLRTALIVSGLIGLLVFAMAPVAPPRLADVGVHDTIRLYDATYQWSEGCSRQSG